MRNLRQFISVGLTISALLVIIGAGCNRTAQAPADRDLPLPVPTVQTEDDKTDQTESEQGSQDQDIARIEPTTAPAGRDWPLQTIYYQKNGVEHETLYMEDPFERHGSNDGTFNTWDWDSLISAVGSPWIFLGRIVSMPAEAVIAPPWQTQISRDAQPVAPAGFELPSHPSGMAKKNQQP